MLEVLILRFDAPLLSFGAPIVDNYGVIQEFPGQSMLAGLLGNALGYDHREAARLQRLQERIRYSARCDQPGARITDFQTVDLGQDLLVGTGWTTRGAPEGRRGGTAAQETHIRFREYWADSLYTIVVTLEPPEEGPDIGDLERAVREPRRPLFLGRKCCMPAAPLLLERRRANSLLDALRQVPRVAARADRVSGPLKAWWPDGEEAPDSRLVPVTDERDWENQIVAGRRLMREGYVNPPEANHG